MKHQYPTLHKMYTHLFTKTLNLKEYEKNTSIIDKMIDETLSLYDKNELVLVEQNYSQLIQKVNAAFPKDFPAMVKVIPIVDEFFDKKNGKMSTKINICICLYENNNEVPSTNMKLDLVGNHNISGYIFWRWILSAFYLYTKPQQKFIIGSLPLPMSGEKFDNQDSNQIINNLVEKTIPAIAKMMVNPEIKKIFHKWNSLYIDHLDLAKQNKLENHLQSGNFDFLELNQRLQKEMAFLLNENPQLKKQWDREINALKTMKKLHEVSEKITCVTMSTGLYNVLTIPINKIIHNTSKKINQNQYLYICMKVNKIGEFSFIPPILKVKHSTGEINVFGAITMSSSENMNAYYDGKRENVTSETHRIAVMLSDEPLNESSLSLINLYNNNERQKRYDQFVESLDNDDFYAHLNALIDLAIVTPTKLNPIEKIMYSDEIGTKELVMTMRDFISYWKQYIPHNYFQQFFIEDEKTEYDVLMKINDNTSSIMDFYLSANKLFWLDLDKDESSFNNMLSKQITVKFIRKNQDQEWQIYISSDLTQWVNHLSNLFVIVNH